MRHRSWPAAAALTAVLAVSACSAGTGGAAEGSAKPGYAAFTDAKLPSGGTLKLQTHIDIGAATGLDPQLADVASSWSLLSLVYETLVTVGPNAEIRPALAESWETPDDTTYVFKLREGVTFSNGRAMTADDVVGSLERLLESQSVWNGQIGPVEKVTKQDDHTVEVKLTEPYTPFLAALANVPAAVLPIKEIEDGSVKPESEMLGTGPFTVAAHRQDVSWSFKRNAKYWGNGRPAVDAVEVTIAPEENARVAALQNGGAGMAVLGNVDSAATLAGAQNVAVATQATSDFYYLMLNSKSGDPKLADPRVRQAINIALDPKQISDVALGGQGKPTAVTPAGLPDACDAAGLPSAGQDIAEAKRLLSQAGAGGLTFTLSIFNTQPAPAVAQVIQQNLKQAGITVKIEQLDEASWAGKVYAEKPAFDSALSWFAGYADAAMAARWWNPDLAVFSKTFMKTDKELNTLIAEAGKATGGERKTALREVCAKVDADAQMIPLVTRPATVAYRTDQVSPTLYATEGYGNSLRHLADLRTKTK